MKRRGFITGAGIFLLFAALRLVNFNSFLWLDEVDFMGNTFEGRRWHASRFVPSEEGEGFRVVGSGTWLETVETSLYITTNATTAPWFPVFILHLATYFFGHQLLLLRLPALVVSLLSLALLRAILSKTVSNPFARTLPLLMFSFSTAAIIYGSSPQPVMYYFLSTAIQVWVFVGILQRRPRDSSVEDVMKNVRRLAWVSFLVFFLNYMSLLICVILLGYYLAAAAVRGHFSLGDSRRVFGEAVLHLLPLGILAFLRYRVGDHHFIYPARSLANLLGLSYDSLTYHFNYAFTPGLYRPSAPNPASWPFVAVFILGCGYFVSKHRRHLLPAAIALIIFFLAAWFEIMPLGGVRHTFTIAPLLYVFAAFGIEGVATFSAGRFKTKRPAGIAAGVLAAYLLVIFSISGARLYDQTRSRLDLEEVAELARSHGADTIAGFLESAVILALMSGPGGEYLERRGLRLEQYWPGRNLPPAGKHLLVSYRHAIDPPFRGMAWGGAIPLDDYEGRRITPLKEDVGPLEPSPDIIAHQSIYYPINGAFIYLVE